MKKKKAVEANTVEETAESLNLDYELFELKKSLETFRRKMKKVRNVVIVFLIIVVLLIGALFGVNQITKASDNSDKLPVNVLTLLMPKSKEVNTGSGNVVTFYIEKYDKYDPSKDQPLDAWSIYYYDNSNNRIDLKNGLYTSSSGKTWDVRNDFLLEGALPNIEVIQNVLTVIEVLFALVIVAFLIYIWYLSYCIREDKKKIEKRCYDISAEIPDFYYSKKQKKNKNKNKKSREPEAENQPGIAEENKD